jgi:hypothetical protein
MEGGKDGQKYLDNVNFLARSCLLAARSRVTRRDEKRRISPQIALIDAKSNHVIQEYNFELTI